VILFSDLETFSELPIQNGTHAYAAHPTTEVMLCAWAEDDGEVRVEEGLHPDYLAAIARADTFVFHNSAFDRTVLAYKGVKLDVGKIHDTMAQALSHGLPGGLGILCDIMGVPVDKAKSKEDAKLVQLFCKPRPRNSELRRATKHTHPREWAAFRDVYTRLDVVSMRELYRRLPRWNYPTRQGEHALWQLDQTVNDRGFAVDLLLARAALDTVGRAGRSLAAATVVATDGRVGSATQRDALLAELLQHFGVELPDMTKGTLERRLEDPDLPEPVKELLRIRLASTTSSTSKYKALLKATSTDGRLRGGLQYCGASRTGRWAGRLFQPQNLPRPKHKAEEIETMIEATKTGALDLLYPYHDDGSGAPTVMTALSSSLRGCLVASEDHELVVADLANIEGRVLAWLAREEWKLDAFAAYDRGEGPDLYLVGAGRILGKRPQDVAKAERQSHGKVPELACGYQGASGAFLTMAALYNMDMPAAQVEGIVKDWRQAHPNTVRLWYGVQDAVRDAIRYPGRTVTYDRLKIKVSGAWLRIALPSGRELVYARPKLEEIDGYRDTITYEGINTYTRQWGKLTTYGGKLVENIVQAIARDVMAHGMILAEAAGFHIILTVHDELLTEVPIGSTCTVERLCSLMSTRPAWASGLPLAAAGFRARRYRKDD
jgi:DNA polymerase